MRALRLWTWKMTWSVAVLVFDGYDLLGPHPCHLNPAENVFAYIHGLQKDAGCTYIHGEFSNLALEFRFPQALSILSYIGPCLALVLLFFVSSCCAFVSGVELACTSFTSLGLPRRHWYLGPTCGRKYHNDLEGQ